MKRVISMVLCLMLVLSLTTTAFAAAIDNQTDHAYQAYQVFSGTQSGADASLGEIKWGSGVDGDKLLQDLRNNDKTKPAFPESVTTAEHVAAILADPNTNIEIIRQFAQLAYNNKKTVAADIPVGATSADLGPGYYLLVDITDLTANPDIVDAVNPALLQVTNAGPIQIKKKYDVPEHDKVVKYDDLGDAEGYGVMEDSPVGGLVEFKLKAEMPLNMDGFEKYTMTFHDDLSDGLTFFVPDDQNLDNAVVLTVGGKTVDVDKYEVVLNPVCNKNGNGYVCDFHVVIPDVMIIDGYEPGSKIEVTYQATLNEHAVINENGNPNHFRLEYANNPNWDPDVPGSGDQPTGVTPWDDVKVYTTEVQITKVDGTTDAPLAGAEFTLTGDSLKKVKVTQMVFTEHAAGAVKDPSNLYWKLKDGTYTTTDPGTDGVDTSVYESTETTYFTEIKEAYKNVEVPQSIAVTTGPDGIIKFSGLGEGTYTVKETKVPAGYNGLKSDLKLTIVFHEAEGRYEYSWSGGAIGTTSSLQVDNQKGSVLPETGGMGTTLIYTIGGLMVAAAAVLLVTKKRMAAE